MTPMYKDGNVVNLPPEMIGDFERTGWSMIPPEPAKLKKSGDKSTKSLKKTRGKPNE